MYYHCRPLKYVEYGKVYPPPLETIKDYMETAYKWLGHYCGYYPQIWLSRSHLSITGYKINGLLKKRQYVIRKRQETKVHQDSVLFGFDIIKGFPVSYRYWELIMMFVLNGKNIEEQNKKIVFEMNDIMRDMKEDELDPESIAWKSCHGDFNLFLNKYLFVEEDQVVVPSLNLKAAKQIICKDEYQKKKLRKMGFIEDRIKIKNFKNDSIL